MNHLASSVLTFVVAVFLFGCAAPQPLKRQVLFVESEFAPYAGDGTSTVAGQTFLKTRGGEVRFGAGCEVVMVPVTTYTTEAFERGVLHGERLATHDPRYARYRRSTVADGNGNFEFRNVPAGDYYLTSVIRWEYATQYGPAMTGGEAYARVKVASGEIAKVIVTR